MRARGEAREMGEPKAWSSGPGSVEALLITCTLQRSLNQYARANGESAGFLRVVTDRTTFVWMAEVLVLEGWRGRAIASQLVASVAEHPELQGLRRTILNTNDAHALYESHGFG